MCQYPAYKVSRKGVSCAPDSSNFFGTPCIYLYVYQYVYSPRGGGGTTLDFEVMRHLLEESGITQQLYVGKGGGGGKSIYFLKSLQICFQKTLISSQ